MSQQHASQKTVEQIPIGLSDNVISRTMDDANMPVANTPIQDRIFRKSYVNTHFKYEQAQTTNCPVDVTGVCVFNHTDTCSDYISRQSKASGLLFGNYCPKHNAILHNQMYTTCMTEKGHDIISVPYKKALFVPYGFLTTFMNVNMTEDNVKTQLANIDWSSTQEKDAICRTYAILTHEVEAVVGNADYTKFKSYFGGIEVQCRNSLDKLNYLQTIYIPIMFSRDFWETTNNAKIHEIKKPAFGNDGMGISNVPLTTLNILDICKLISIKLEAYKDSVSYAPNCKLYNDRIVMGTGFGLNHAMSNYDMENRNYQSNCFHELIEPKLKDMVMSMQFDYVVMHCGTHNNVPLPAISVPILLSKESPNKFNVFRIHSKDATSIPARM